MTHLAPLWGRQTRDVGDHGLFHKITGISRRFGLLRAADFADHHDSVGLWIIFKKLQNIAEG